MLKSSVLALNRQSDSSEEAKSTVSKTENKIAKTLQPVDEDSMKTDDWKMPVFARKLISRKEDSVDGSEDAASSKRNSILPGGVRPSISAGSSARLSIVGLMASRRFAKKLASKALDKRDSTAVRYEPTYRLEPKMKFQSGPVLEIVKDVVDNRLKDMKYNPRIAPNMNRILGDEIKDRVKRLNFDRYKIVVVVMIGQKKGQGIMASSRCSWDDKVDSYVSHTFQNKHIFCTCSVYGTYHE